MEWVHGLFLFLLVLGKTSPLLTSNTLLQSWTWCIYNIQYHQRKEYFIEKMNPSECGRALKYITCKGKNGRSIIPKKDAEKWKLFYQPYYHKHQKYYAEGTTIEKDAKSSKIGSFLCSLDNLLQKNVIVLFFGNQISK